MSSPGIYFLVFKNNEAEIRIGAHGCVSFKYGWHIYTGSALGNAGVLRVRRHFSLAEKKDKNPRWHVDYLLISDDFSLQYALFAETTERLECEAAKMTGRESVAGFGCSDCLCNSHLFYRDSDPFDELCRVFSSMGLKIEKINFNQKKGSNSV